MQFIRDKAPALLAVVFLGGVILGAIGYALVGPFRSDIPPEVQSGALIAAGAVVAGVFALAATLVGGSFAAQGARDAATIAARASAAEGVVARVEARRADIATDKSELVRKIVSLGNRHAQEVEGHVSAHQQRAGMKGDPRLPEIHSTHPIEDAINELYTLGAQHTADLAWEMLRSLWELDRYPLVVDRDQAAHPGVIQGLNQDDGLDFDIWLEVQRTLKTMVMDAHVVDVGETPFVQEGTLPGRDFLWRVRNEVVNARREAARAVETNGPPPPPWLTG